MLRTVACWAENTPPTIGPGSIPVAFPRGRCSKIDAATRRQGDPQASAQTTPSWTPGGRGFSEPLKAPDQILISLSPIPATNNAALLPPQSRAVIRQRGLDMRTNQQQPTAAAQRCAHTHLPFKNHAIGFWSAANAGRCSPPAICETLPDNGGEGGQATH